MRGRCSLLLRAKLHLLEIEKQYFVEGFLKFCAFENLFKEIRSFYACPFFVPFLTVDHECDGKVIFIHPFDFNVFLMFTNQVGAYGFECAAIAFECIEQFLGISRGERERQVAVFAVNLIAVVACGWHHTCTVVAFGFQFPCPLETVVPLFAFFETGQYTVQLFRGGRTLPTLGFPSAFNA